MFKRLIIAVLALGLIMAFSGTAFSDVDHGKTIAPGDVYNTQNPSNPRFSTLKKGKVAQVPASRPSVSDLKTVPFGTQVPAHSAPAYSCGFSEYDNGSLAFFWRIPDNFTAPPYEMSLAAVRFSTDPGIRCTLKTGSVLVYKSGTKGNPGLKVYLYDDDGFGFPGAKLDSVSFPQGSFTGSGTVWADADFSPAGWVFENGEEYHIGINVIKDTPDDSLAYLSDNATGHAPASSPRNNFFLAGVGYNYWTSVASVFAGSPDYGFFVAAETCCAEIPFTDCYTQSYNGPAAYVWAAPDASFGDSAYAMRFSVGGPETLSSVDFAVYNASAAGFKPSAYIFGDDAIRVTIYDDDGFGLPGTQIAQVTVPGGSYAAFPAYTNAVFAPLVLSSTFHIALSSSAVFGSNDCEYFLTDNGSTATGRGSDNYGGTWYDMLTLDGVDGAFLIKANLCRDQFSQCHAKDSYDGLTYLYSVPDANAGSFPWTLWAQKYTASEGANCEIKTADILLGWGGASDAARASTRYKRNTKVSIYTDVAGSPGVSLGSVTLTPADYAAAGNVGWTGATYVWDQPVNFDPLNIQLTGDFWLVIEPLTPKIDSGVRVLLDNDGLVGAAPAQVYDPEGGAIWYDAGPALTGSATLTWNTSISYCCIPFPERACTGSSDWPRPGGNNAQDGLSQVSLSDSWCDLNRLWSYNETNASAGTVSGIGPIIYNGKVVANFFDNYKKFDLATGTLNFTWGPGGTGVAPFALGTQLTGSGSVYNVGGTDILFLGGGTNNNLVAVNFNTGAVIWGLATGPNQGPVRGGGFIVLNQAGTDVLYYATNSGNVLAKVASTGALWPGWGVNPVALGANTGEVVGATDGSGLYYTTQPGAPNNGTVFRVNATTGAIAWSVPPANLKLGTVYPGHATLREVFTAAASTDGAFVYANSAIPVTVGADFPSDGILYKLDAATGTVAGFAQSESVLRMAPVVDPNHVYVGCRSPWAPPSLGGEVLSFDKNTMALTWVYESQNAGRVRGIAQSCEPGGQPDQLYVTVETGWLSVLNADNGDEIFNRRWDNLGTGTDVTPRGVAIGNGPYVVVTTRNQYLMTLKKGSDRPRMEFQTYNAVGPVEFGSNPALSVNLGPLITNTGCAPLHIGTVVADVNPFVPQLPVFSFVQSNVNEAMRAGTIADLIATQNFSSKGVQLASGPDNMTIASRGENRNRAASAAPPWLVSITDPSSGDVVNPGDTMDLVIVVDQNLISRGPQSAFVQVGSDDPDFFLNDPTVKPQFKMTLVGGCLLDTTELKFGIGSANLEHVWNTGRLGDGDIAIHGFRIDGDGGSYYQGSYVYAMSQRRWAVNVSEWFSNVTDNLISLQADPNWCDTTCKPFLTSPYNVGSISSNGITYTPIAANMICRSYLDSVQNFDDGGGGWDVTQYSAAPFDQDSTMGLYVKSHVVGAVNEPGLTNVTVDIMSITERNGRAVPGFFLGSMNDIDLGGGDTVGMDQSISSAYAWRKTGGAGIWGQIKLPFGCGQAPMINTRGLGGDQAFFAGGGVGLNAYFDSAYQFMSAASGSISSQAAPNGSDFEQHITHYGHSFAANETVQVGVAFYGFPTLVEATTTTSAPATVKTMARLVNKWTGWGRGDVNNDNVINLADITYLAAYVNFSGPGPIPFMHLGDVNASGGNPDQADVMYMINFYFNCGPCPSGAFVF